MRWHKGQKGAIAKLAGISRQHVCDILHGRRYPSVKTALKLGKACRDIGVRLTEEDWAFPEKSAMLRKLRENKK